jgi:hypothetical protein
MIPPIRHKKKGAQGGWYRQGWRMAFLYNLPMFALIPVGGSVLPA